MSGAIIGTGPVFPVLPNVQLGNISVVTAINNAFGAWVQFIAALTTNGHYWHVTADLPVTFNTRYRIQFGTGGAGSEVVKHEFVYDDDYVAGGNDGLIVGAWIFKVPSATRTAFRALALDSASGITLTLRVSVFEE